MEEDDWGLHAVVRSYVAATNTSTTTTASTVFPADFSNQTCFSSFTSGVGEQSGNLFSVSDPSEARNAFGDLHDLYKPFSPKFLIPSPVQAKPISSNSSSLIVSVDPTQLNQVQKQRQVPRQFIGGSVNRTNTTTHSATANSNTSRSKKRKNQSKEMRRVPADALYSDIWAWRKYGQKPIKGSPYPRGYYRCSSSKGCMARKQVERDQSDPGMFKVTYSAEHNHPAPTHRNSLAGSTRQKPVTATETTTAIADKASPSASKPARSSSPVLSVAQSQNSESREEKDLISEEDDGEGEEEEFGVSDSALDDDFFAGLDELAAGDCFSDPFPSASFGHQWLTNNAAAAAGSI